MEMALVGMMRKTPKIKIQKRRIHNVLPDEERAGAAAQVDETAQVEEKAEGEGAREAGAINNKNDIFSCLLI